MRFKRTPMHVDKSRRCIRRFAWSPARADNEVVWLESYWQLEEFLVCQDDEFWYKRGATTDVQTDYKWLANQNLVGALSTPMLAVRNAIRLDRKDEALRRLDEVERFLHMKGPQ
jgi:hypothetical protein